MGAAIVSMDYQQMLAAVKAEDATAGQNRYLGKFANLSLQYRTSPRKLRVKARVDYDIPIELPEAQRIHATYKRTYPGVPVYWERQIALVKQLGYVETFGGNRINVVGDWNGGWGWSMGSTAINARIQGTGADQKHLAMALIKDYLRGIGGRMLFDLHDGLYLLIPTQHSYRACVDIKRILDNLPYKEAWGFTPPIPMPWDCKIGKAWGRLKEFKFD
jgi:DNA polymerase I-like protein with 3'-5' exonuclease and polymerase domains